MIADTLFVRNKTCPANIHVSEVVMVNWCGLCVLIAKEKTTADIVSFQLSYTRPNPTIKLTADTDERLQRSLSS